MADIKEVLSEFSQIEILGEVLRRDRIERASSPMGMHLVNALSTFGTKGQDEVRRANAARNNRDLTKKAAGNVRTWNPAEAPGLTRLSARVAERYFAGDHVRLVVKLKSGEDVALKTPRLEAETLPAAGADVTIGWRAADAYAFPPEDAPQTIKEHAAA